MAFDSTRNVTVLFGGMSASGVVGGTYEYDGQSWALISTPDSPSPRQFAAMAYDSHRHVIVLHGGMTATGYSNQTFEYDGETWTLRSTSGPGVRYGHSIAYDAANQRTVLFGGQNAGGTYVAGTWTWNGTTWSPVPGNEPPARSHACMVYVPQLQRTILFGGNQSTTYPTGLWEFDGTSWMPKPSNGPGSRTHATMALHQTAGLVLTGGSQNLSIFDDTWTLPTNAGAPTFTTSPTSQSMPAGHQVQFTAAAQGPITSWRWLRNGQPVSNGERITGATTPTLTINALLDADAGQYQAEAGNTCGARRSNPATLTVVPACSSADFDGDGDSGTDADIESFFACLAGTCCPSCYAGGADFNADGDSGTDADIESFFRVLAGGPC
jgi:hypothetical protein